MKSTITLSIIIVILTSIANGQNWKYTSKENAFDGKYCAASIIGKGGKYPFNNPSFVINFFEKDNTLNIYIADAGYAGCDNKKVIIKFNGDNNLYEFNATTNNDKDSWFLEFSYEDKENNISVFKLLEKMKGNAKMHTRLISDCGHGDYEFSLNGSSSAINKVTSSYYAKVNKIKEEIRKAKAEEDKIYAIIASGRTLKANTFYKVSILFEPKNSSFYKSLTLEKGEEILFSVYPENPEYFILKKSSTIELPQDSTFYITKFSIDLKTVQEVKE